MRPLFLNAYRHNYRRVLVGLKCQRPIVFLHLHERARPRLGGLPRRLRRLKNIRITTQIDARLLVDANPGAVLQRHGTGHNGGQHLGRAQHFAA